MKGIHRILLATDFSRASKSALARTMKLAKLSHARVTIVHVLVPAGPYAGGSYAVPTMPEGYSRMLADLRNRAQEQMDRLVRAGRKAGVRASGLLVEGIPHDRIVRAARSTRADLIAMGTHGHTGMSRLLLGSVAARVVATAPCPVLTVRGK